jgi:lipopolysaccharide/colanic/teichoic acid biosynthesis glycosyltransferase
MVKRLLDVTFALLGLLLTSPLLLFFAYLIKRHDNGPALYLPIRAGRDGVPFKMFKLRSMVVNADKSGVSSTANSDSRITPIGAFIRRFKVDELMQLINVLKGEMSLVGPRPNVLNEVQEYTKQERHLLDVRPGITDYSSIVFSDEGAILEGSSNPDLTYNQIIRPWKSRLGLFYVANHSILIDITLILLTAMSLFSRQLALRGVALLLQIGSADSDLIKVAKRTEPLLAAAPPGADCVVSLTTG